jgi:NDP-sugar pyrophosphorylase family protein
MLPVAILAGGLATRLRPITQAIPKALIEVAGKPFIEHQLEYLHRQGVTSIVLCVGYLGEMIQEIVGDGSRWNMQVKYSEDGPLLLGTGGALKQALPMLGEQFFILYGDSYLPIDFVKVETAFINSGQLGLMTVLRNQNLWDRSNVHFKDGQLIQYNKEIITSQMHYIDYGLGVLKSEALKPYLMGHPFDLGKVYNDLSVQKKIAGYEVYERFYEIGSQQGIKDAEEYLLRKLI